MYRLLFILTLLIAHHFPGAAQNATVVLQGAIYEEEVSGDLTKAIGMYESLIRGQASPREMQAEALWRLGRCHEKLQTGKSEQYYTRILREFPEQEIYRTKAQQRLTILRPEIEVPSATEAMTKNKLLRTSKVYSRENFYGTISPDGRSFAFANWNNGNLALHDRTVGHTRDLTKDGSWERSKWCDRAVWSSDSKSIAYCWIVKDARTQIRLYHLPTASVRELTGYFENAMLWPLQWTDDDNYILATLYDRNIARQKVVLVTVADGSLQIIRETPKGEGKDGWISICDAGRHLIYDKRVQHGESDIYLVNVDGTGDCPLIQNPSRKKVISWLPGHQGFLYYSNISGDDALWKATMDDRLQVTNTELLVDGVTSDYTPVGLTDAGQYFYLQSSFVGDIHVVNIDCNGGGITGEINLFTDDQTARTGPFWSPDGSRLAYFRSDHVGGHSLEIRNVETGQEHSLMPDIQHFEGYQDGEDHACWLDDRHLLLTYFDHGYQIASINAESGESRHLTRGHFPKVRISNQSFIYVQLDSLAEHVSIFDLSTETSTRLFTTREYAILKLRLSRDNNTLAMIVSHRTRETSALVMLSLTDGAMKTLWESDGKWILFEPAGVNWCHDGRSVLFAVTDADQEKQQLLSVDVSTREVHTTGGVVSGKSNFMRSIQIHPLYDRIAFSSNRKIDNIWALENF